MSDSRTKPISLHKSGQPLEWWGLQQEIVLSSIKDVDVQRFTMSMLARSGGQQKFFRVADVADEGVSLRRMEGMGKLILHCRGTVVPANVILGF